MPENKLRSVCVHSRRTDKRMERNLNIYIEFFKARSNNFVVEENEVGGVGIRQLSYLCLELARFTRSKS